MSDQRRRDQIQDAAVAGTFPASDPPSGTAEQGARAVAPEEMMNAGTSAPVRDAVTLQRSFADGEAAKLALEGLVRDGPIDRRCAEIHPQAGGAELRIQAPAGDADRLRKLLAAA